MELISERMQAEMTSQFTTVPAGYRFSLNDISTIIVAILGAGGINAIITSIVQHHKKTIKVKAKEGVITDIEIDSYMSKEELTELIGEIRSSFEQTNNQGTQDTN